MTDSLSSLAGLVTLAHGFPPINRWVIFFRPDGLGCGRALRPARIYPWRSAADATAFRVAESCCYGCPQGSDAKRPSVATLGWYDFILSGFRLVIRERDLNLSCEQARLWYGHIMSP